MKVAVVKYNAGNIFSVVHALQRIGVEPLLTDSPKELRNADRVIFPGQGDATGINAVSILLGGDVEGIYTVGGAKVNNLQKGMNIIRTADGKTQKVLVK